LSRVGKLPIPIPEGIQVNKKEDVISIQGKNGVLEHRIHPAIKVEIESGLIRVMNTSQNRIHRSLHGLTRSLLQNMIIGLTKGYEIRLEIVGVGYRAEIKGKTLTLQLGYSHPIYFVPPSGIILEVPVPNSIVIKGIDKQLVGQVASKIRSFRPPEPYKGKGIRYVGEYVRKKAGKATA
jgi:large subunit ribosomal protein L6